jgi:hypothetical protein
MTLEPVLVTVWPPSTAKLCSMPSGGADAAEVALPGLAL